MYDKKHSSDNLYVLVLFSSHGYDMPMFPKWNKWKMLLIYSLIRGRRETSRTMSIQLEYDTYKLKKHGMIVRRTAHFTLSIFCLTSHVSLDPLFRRRHISYLSSLHSPHCPKSYLIMPANSIPSPRASNLPWRRAHHWRYLPDQI